MSDFNKRIGFGIAFMLTALLITGCSPKAGVTTTQQTKDGKDAPKKDESEAPHGGKLYAVPDHKYHIELLINQGKKEATIYLLDEGVRKSVPTNAESVTMTVKNGTPLQITLTPQRQDDDPKDAASRFAGTHERLEKPVEDEKIEFSGMINGKPYSFTLDKD